MWDLGPGNALTDLDQRSVLSVYVFSLEDEFVSCLPEFDSSHSLSTNTTLDEHLCTHLACDFTDNPESHGGFDAGVEQR